MPEDLTAPLADRPPFDADPEEDLDDGPSPRVADALEGVLSADLTIAERQELCIFLIGEIAGELAEEADDDNAAGLVELITRLQVAAETIASVDLSDDEEEEEGEEEPED